VNELDHIILDAKLKTHEVWAPAAVDFLIAWMQEHSNELIAMARGRHVWGHYIHGDRNYAEYNQDRLIAEAAEELADGINYISLYLRRQANSPH
jgi:hypothetical protein